MATVKEKQAMRKRMAKRAAAGKPVKPGKRFERIIASKRKKGEIERVTIQGRRTDAAQKALEATKKAREKTAREAAAHLAKQKAERKTTGVLFGTTVTTEKKSLLSRVAAKIKEGAGKIFTRLKKGQEEITEATKGAQKGIIIPIGLGGLGGLGIKALSRIGKAGSKGLARFKTGKMVQTTITGGPAFQVNTKTASATASMLSKMAGKMKKPAYVVGAVGAMIGTYPWAEWAAGEAKEIMGFTVRGAIKTGDVDLIRDTIKTSDEIFEPELWEKIARLIPGANIAVAFRRKVNALQAQRAINDKIMNDEIIKIETGETDSDMWNRIREEQVLQDRQAIDYYNEERRKQLEWEEEAADRDMAEDAIFWAKERAKQREKEAEDRQAIADFWTAYRKTRQLWAEDNRPSNLNFGLL